MAAGVSPTVNLSLQIQNLIGQLVSHIEGGESDLDEGRLASIIRQAAAKTRGGIRMINASPTPPILIASPILDAFELAFGDPLIFNYGERTESSSRTQRPSLSAKIAICR